MKNIKKTNLKDLYVNPIKIQQFSSKIVDQQRPRRITENYSQTINVQKFLKQFKSERSNNKTERSNQSLGNTKQRSTNYLNENTVSRYNNTSNNKGINDTKKVIKQVESKGILKLNITSPAPLRKVQSEISKYNDREKDSVSLKKMVQLIKKFEKQNENSNFQGYIKSIASFNEILNQLTCGMDKHSPNKQILKGLQNIICQLSKRCIVKLFEKQNQLQETADQNIKIANQSSNDEMAVRYNKKIAKLVEIINQKEKKQRQVNKLLYFLRKNGVNIQEAWRKSSKQQKKSSDKIQKCYTQEN